MLSSHGHQPRRAAAAHDADGKGLGRGRAMGELIPDKLFGQEDSKMSSLPPLAAAVAAAAAAAARAVLPHRHRAAWCWWRRTCWRAYALRPRPPAAALRGPPSEAFLPHAACFVRTFCRTALLASVRYCRWCARRARGRACGQLSARRTSTIHTLGEVLPDWIACSATGSCGYMYTTLYRKK